MCSVMMASTPRRSSNSPEMSDGFSAIRGELKDGLVGVRTDLRAEMAEMKTELRDDIAGLGRDMTSQIIETQRQMRVLHEQVIERIALIGEARRPRPEAIERQSLLVRRSLGEGGRPKVFSPSP